jgi:hypothetical protein
MKIASDGMATVCAHRKIPKPTAVPHVKYKRSVTFFDWGEWNTPARRSPKIRLAEINAFNARGMKWVYGRGEDYSRPGYVFNMSVWLTKDDRLFARFWARSKGISDKSFEVIGFSHEGLPLIRNVEQDVYGNEVWAPWCLREAYSDWIDEQVCYILPSYYDRM